MNRPVLLVLGLFLVPLGGGGAAFAQPSAPAVHVDRRGPSLSLPVCAELAFDAAAYVHDLQVALAYHRITVAAESGPGDADPSALLVQVDTRCAREAREVTVHIAHLETGRAVRGEVLLEGDTPELRGQWLARATARLLEVRWAELSHPDYFPAGNPYRLARYDGFPHNPYRDLGDFTPEQNPYFFEPAPVVPPPAPRGTEVDVAPNNPYCG